MESPFDETQALLRLALSVGKGRELGPMLHGCLAEMVQATRSFGVMVIRQTTDASPPPWTESWHAPDSLLRDPRYQLLTDGGDAWWLPGRLGGQREAEVCLWRRGAYHTHVFAMRGFGLLVLFREGEQLDEHFRDALGAVVDNLSHACIACVQHTELGRWAQFERILMRWSLRFMTVAGSELDQMINDALREMGRFVMADHAYLIRYDFDSYTASGSHEWCEQGVGSVISVLGQQFPLHGCEEMVRRHQSGEVYAIPDVHALTADNPQRDLLRSRGVRTVISIPLMSAEGCMGYVGFDAVHSRRHWDGIDTTVLKIMADIFANAEIKRSQQAQILAVQQELTASIYEATTLAQRAEAASEAKSRFLAIMSHEIRTPITAMLGMAELLLGTPLDEKQRRYGNTIRQSGEALLGIINDVLDFSEIEANNVKINPEPVDLCALLRETVDLLKPKAAERGNRLELVLDPMMPDGVVVDPVRLRQVVWNTVGNAIKFTERGSIVVDCRLAVHEQHGPDMHRVYFEVRDSGIGIREELIDKLFQPFFQAEAHALRHLEGIGLGLSIVKRLIDAMNGCVGIDSTPGKGTTMWFYLDLRQATRSEIDNGQEGKAVDSELETARSGGSLRALAPHVLLVDDNDSVRELASETLDLLGCRVSVAEDGFQALEQLAEKSFHLILMDCQMPVMDGFQAARAIRGLDSEAANTPIIALTAAVMSDERAACVEAGMNDVLPKPYTRKKLRAMLERWLVADTGQSSSPSPSPDPTA